MKLIPVFSQRRRNIRTGAFIIFQLTLILFQIKTFAQNASDVDPELTGLNQNVSPVTIDGDYLFLVRGISSYPAEMRAASIGRRIEKAAANSAISSDSVKIFNETDRLKIFAGSEFIMNIYSGDASSEGIASQVFAEVVANKVKTAIDSYRYERTRPVIYNHVLNAVIATAIALLLLLIVIWLIKKADLRLQQRIKTRIESLENKSFNLIKSKQLWSAFHALFKALKVIITIVIISFYIQFVFELFPWTRGMGHYLLSLFTNPLLSLGKSFIHFLPSLVFLLIIFFVTRYLLKLTKLFFAGIGQGGIVVKNFHADWAIPTFRIVRTFVIVFAVIVAYPYIPGSETSAFKGVSVFLGVLISLGSSSFIGNVIAGYSMTYRSAFKKGDKIKINDIVGFVEEQKLLVTRLRSVKNEEIIIPNSELLNSNIINYNSRANDPGIILHTTVGIGYETPWRQVDAMLKEAADRTEGLMKQPPPYVLKKSLGDFAVVYEINAYCNNISRMHTCYTELHQNILDLFNENNVQIMTPAYEGDPETPKVVPKEKWDAPLAGGGK